MRIAILTLPSHTNYGWILQAYALQTYLQEYGHEVEFIEEYKKERPLWIKMISYAKRFLQKVLFDKNTLVFKEKKQEEVLSIAAALPHAFIDKYLKIKKVQSFALLEEKDYDAYIVGSDQIWRPQYFSGKIENAFLSFTKKWHVLRIAYAPSFGTNEWEYTTLQTEKCKKLLCKFDKVMLREDDGVDLCRKFLHTEAYHVVDPTLLLEAKDYLKLLCDLENKSMDDVLLTYILDNNSEKEQLINNYSELLSLSICPIQVLNENVSVGFKIQPSVEDWIRSFSTAGFVITDSFHGCVFSIIFRKQFLVIANKKRGLSRMLSLLRKLGLEDRLVFLPFSLEYKKLDLINYSEKGYLLNEWRCYSANMLNESLMLNN